MNRRVERKIGGPGTGKTHLLLDLLTREKDRLGLAAEEIGLCTFTRNGRKTLSERAADAWGCDPEILTKAGFFRTAHSIAYRQIQAEKGQLIQGKDGAEWLEKVFPGQVNASVTESGTSYGRDTTVSRALAAWDLARNRIAPLDAILGLWRATGGRGADPAEVVRVVGRYEAAKTRDSRLDYTDLVARFAGVRFSPVSAPEFVHPEGDVPESLRVLAVDEAQDSSALVDRVCRRLADSPRMEAVFLCGDPYQSIYSFNGSDYRHFLSWEAEESVMPRSYRCPRQVMDLGDRCIRQMRRGYVNRGILPADHDGQIIYAMGADDALQYAGSGSVLILGRCNFGLSGYQKALTERMIPHSSLDRVGATASSVGFAAIWKLQHGQPITGHEWTRSISMISANHAKYGPMLKRGLKSAWAKGAWSDMDVILPTNSDMSLIGCTNGLIDVIRRGDWPTAMSADNYESSRDWYAAAKRHGLQEACDPRIKLSTIHSAKGGEADTVILSTISSQAVEGARCSDSESHDEECRVAYVAVTRARKRLVIVSDGGDYSMGIPA